MFPRKMHSSGLIAFGVVVLVTSVVGGATENPDADKEIVIHEPAEAFKRVINYADLLRAHVENLRQTIRGFLQNSVTVMDTTRNILRTEKKQAKSIKNAASEAIRSFSSFKAN
ncbi:unnamed protein product [Bemisia tabaci]|uniref:Salivary protein 9 n=1 Tax=Bemisia tabaci TaxID=7038 RepID=A0A2I6PLV5_BEMTA|nr:PREDICTED: uncharacterized protein LOC109033433 [Bemisia tabaci]AUM61061.1 salivary protein Bt56 [Bemisia tabaci]QBA31242.1 salivary protein 9 [Bemisia tabaci]CAH0388142.1 unnamed protein product [Bemisia tabaci]